MSPEKSEVNKESQKMLLKTGNAIFINIFIKI